MGCNNCKGISAKNEEDSSSASLEFISVGDPDENIRLINHPKESDMTCHLIPIHDILPSNHLILRKKSSLNMTLKDQISRVSLSRSYMRRDSVSRFLPCVEGITLQVLEDILNDHPGSMNLKTEDLVNQVFKPLIGDRKCALLEWLRGKKDSCGFEAVGVLDYFVSYSWRYQTEDLVEALREIEIKLPEKPGKPIYFFLDCVCFNQWNPMDDLNNLDATIGKSKGLLTVITDWTNPVPFTRAWCLLEMVLAIESKVKLHVAMTHKAMEALRYAFFSDFDNVTAKIDQINVREAEATKEEDLVNIRGMINVTIGYTTLNRKVMDALKNWLLEEGEQILELIKGQEYCDNEAYLYKLEVMAKMRRRMGHYHAAGKMYWTVYNARCHLQRATNTAAIIAQCNYGNHLREQKQFKVAQEILSDCVKKSRKKFGQHHTITLIAESNWGLLQKDLANLDKAEAILTSVVSKGIFCKDEWVRNCDNVTRSSNLALVLVLRGKTKQALSLLEDCYNESKKLFGRRHAYVLTDMHNLGAVLLRAGHIAGAQEKLQKCYEGRSEQLGAEDFRTLITLWWWSIAMVKGGELEKARDKLWEVSIYLEVVHEASKEQVRMCRELLEAITPERLNERLKHSEPAVRMMVNRRKMPSVGV